MLSFQRNSTKVTQLFLLAKSLLWWRNWLQTRSSFVFFLAEFACTNRQSTSAERPPVGKRDAKIDGRKPGRKMSRLQSPGIERPLLLHRHFCLASCLRPFEKWLIDSGERAQICAHFLGEKGKTNVTQRWRWWRPPPHRNYFQEVGAKRGVGVDDDFFPETCGEAAATHVVVVVVGLGKIVRFSCGVGFPAPLGL